MENSPSEPTGLNRFREPMSISLPICMYIIGFSILLVVTPADIWIALLVALLFGLLGLVQALVFGVGRMVRFLDMGEPNFTRGRTMLIAMTACVLVFAVAFRIVT